MPRIRGSAKKAELLTLEEAVKKYMRNDIVCAFGGFTGFNRNPFAFAWETARQGFKNIHVMDRHGSQCTWLLNAVGAIKIYETNWMGWGEMAGKLDINMEKLYKQGKIILEDYSHGATAMRFLFRFINHYAFCSKEHSCNRSCIFKCNAGYFNRIDNARLVEIFIFFSSCIETKVIFAFPDFLNNN